MRQQSGAAFFRRSAAESLLCSSPPRDCDCALPMNLQTLNEMFFAVVERNDRVVVMHRRAIQWISISSSEFYQSVVGVARALQEWGIRKGDRVAILSENRPEWTIADFACLLLGAVVVPVYTTLTGRTDGVHSAGFGSANNFCLQRKAVAESSQHTGSNCNRTNRGNGCGRDCARRADATPDA